MLKFESNLRRMLVYSSYNVTFRSTFALSIKCLLFYSPCFAFYAAVQPGGKGAAVPQ